tara:strand:- start:459 stop:662 length:204 start_codon:yes stop_codon:yes gene_type:complete
VARRKPTNAPQRRTAFEENKMTFIYTWQDILLGGLMVFFITIFSIFFLVEWLKRMARKIKDKWSKTP